MAYRPSGRHRHRAGAWGPTPSTAHDTSLTHIMRRPAHDDGGHKVLTVVCEQKTPPLPGSGGFYGLQQVGSISQTLELFAVRRALVSMHA